MTSSKILTIHPDGKQGVNIDRTKYVVLKDFIIDTVKANPGITYRELDKLGNEKLSGSFEGSISWYLVTVKLDLEARNMIRRIPGTSPHQLEIE